MEDPDVVSALENVTSEGRTSPRIEEVADCEKEKRTLSCSSSSSSSSSSKEDEKSMKKALFEDEDEDDVSSYESPPSNVDVLKETLKYFHSISSADFGAYLSCGCPDPMIKDDNVDDKITSPAIRAEKRKDDGCDDIIWTSSDETDAKRPTDANYDNKGGFSVLEEHARINFMLKHSRGLYLHVKDPYIVKSSASLLKFQKSTKRSKTKDFFVKSLNTKDGFSFFKSVSDCLYGTDRFGLISGTTKPWRETMASILDYACRLCFGTDLDVLRRMDQETLFSSFIVNSIPKNERDSRSCDTCARFSFVFRFFNCCLRFTNTQNGDKRLKIPDDILNFTMFHAHALKEYLLAVLTENEARMKEFFEGPRFDSKWERGLESLTTFIFEPIVCCMYRTGIVLYGYDPYSQSIFPMRSYVNGIVADETKIFMYLMEFSGIVDNLTWCKERTRTNVEIVLKSDSHLSSTTFYDPPIDENDNDVDDDNADDPPCVHFKRSVEQIKLHGFKSSADRDLLEEQLSCDFCCRRLSSRSLNLIRSNLDYCVAYLNYKGDRSKSLHVVHDEDEDRFKSTSTINFVAVPSFVTDEDLMLNVKDDSCSQRFPKKRIFDVPEENVRDTRCISEKKPFSPKIKVTWSNITNGQKGDLLAHVVFDGSYDEASRAMVKRENSDSHAMIESLSTLKCVTILKKFYDIDKMRVYEMDMMHYSFKTATIPFVIIDPTMDDIPTASLIVFRYDFDDLKKMDDTMRSFEGKFASVSFAGAIGRNASWRDAPDGDSSADEDIRFINKDIVRSFKCIYYRNGNEFKHKENIVDERRASFPVLSTADERKFVEGGKWRESKLYFIWFLDDCNPSMRIEKNATQSSSSSSSSFGISNVEIKLFANETTQ